MCKEREFIKTEIVNRTGRNTQLFFIKPKVVTSLLMNIDIISRKQYLGLSVGSNIILEPIYDEVNHLSGILFSVGIFGCYALYNASSKKFVSKFIYKSIHLDNLFIKLETLDEDLHYLDIESNKILIKGYFDELSTKNTGEYLWVKTGNFYDFVSRNSGQRMHIPGMILAYDTSYGMYGINEYRKVICYNEKGISASEHFRRMVKNAGGYITLRNLTLKIEHVVDINGNIIN